MLGVSATLSLWTKPCVLCLCHGDSLRLLSRQCGIYIRLYCSGFCRFVKSESRDLARFEDKSLDFRLLIFVYAQCSTKDLFLGTFFLHIFQKFDILEIRIKIQRRSVTICDFLRRKNIRKVKFHIPGIWKTIRKIWGRKQMHETIWE